MLLTRIFAYKVSDLSVGGVELGTGINLKNLSQRNLKKVDGKSKTSAFVEEEEQVEPRKDIS